MTNIHESMFIFNTNTTQTRNGVSKVFLDKNGNIQDTTQLEYGIYNKVIKINITKLFLIKKHKLGLGDIIDFFTKFLYIKNLIMYITNGNCGCEQRRIKFNKYYINYYTFKIRKLYHQDELTVNYINNLKKLNIKIPKQKDKTTMNKSSGPIKNITQESTQNIEATNKTPINPVKIKKSCGCSKKTT